MFNDIEDQTLDPTLETTPGEAWSGVIPEPAGNEISEPPIPAETPTKSSVPATTPTPTTGSGSATTSAQASEAPSAPSQNTIRFTYAYPSVTATDAATGTATDATADTTADTAADAAIDASTSSANAAGTNAAGTNAAGASATSDVTTHSEIAIPATATFNRDAKITALASVSTGLVVFGTIFIVAIIKLTQFPRAPKAPKTQKSLRAKITRTPKAKVNPLM